MANIPKKIANIYWQATEIYANALSECKEDLILEYIKQRGFDKDFFAQYNIGLSPYNKTKSFLYENLITSNKLEPIELLETGLIKINKDKRLLEDYFGSRRLIFPVFENGSIKGFSSRTIFNNVMPKYKTLKYGTIGIYNGNLVKYNPKNLYICEGAIDCLSMLRMGFNAIGILGIENIGLEHQDIFLGFDNNIIILFDNDSNNAGFDAIFRVAKILNSFGLGNISYKQLPKKNDQKKIDVNAFMINEGQFSAKIKISELPAINIDPIFIHKSNNTDTKYNKSKIVEPEITSVVSKFVELKQEGPLKYRGQCPFPGHNDSTPSFIVYENTNTYKCFGCGKFGGPINFLMEFYGTDYKGAISHLC